MCDNIFNNSKQAKKIPSITNLGCEFTCADRKTTRAANTHTMYGACVVWLVCRVCVCAWFCNSSYVVRRDGHDACALAVIQFWISNKRREHPHTHTQHTVWSETNLMRNCVIKPGVRGWTRAHWSSPSTKGIRCAVRLCTEPTRTRERLKDARICRAFAIVYALALRGFCTDRKRDTIYYAMLT